MNGEDFSSSKTDAAPKGRPMDMTIINTNARSLCPKIGSLIDCFNELDAGIAVVTETWLRDGLELEKDKEDLSRGCLLYTSPSPRDRQKSRMPSSA